jgi:AraC-like DNA-binding protein
MDPVSAEATGTFLRWPVAATGLGAFSAVWAHQLPRARTAPIVVASDATIDLQWIDGVFRVAGPDREAATEHLPAGAVVIGFRFRPAAAAPWLGMPVREITDRRADLAALWGAGAERVAREVVDEGDMDRLVRSLQTVVGRMAPGFVGTDREMRAAYRLVAADAPAGAPLVPWLCRALGMSERSLRRRFDEAFGYGPKTLDRILRHRRYRRLAEHSSESTAILALEAGYSDQAHLVRESRRLTGSTPGMRKRAARDDGGASRR